MPVLNNVMLYVSLKCLGELLGIETSHGNLPPGDFFGFRLIASEIVVYIFLRK